MALQTRILRALFRNSTRSIHSIVIRHDCKHNQSESICKYSDGLQLCDKWTNESTWTQAIQVDAKRIFCSKSTESTENITNEPDTINDDGLEFFSDIDVRQFYEGHAGDRNIRQIKVASLRFDTIASKAFGLSKK